MAENQDQSNDQQNDQENVDGNKDPSVQTDLQKDTNLVDKVVQEKLDEALKDIKSKLDKAYGARDEALKKVSDFEQAKRAEELKRLQEEGKYKEAYDMQIAEERTKREVLEKQNVELTRDINVRNALASYPFRNDSASEMAYREIIGQLVRDESGLWVHRSGVSVKDFVKTFAEVEDNAFLFKPKVNNGTGNSGNKPTNTSSDPKSLFAMSQEDVLKMAREGKLPGR